MQLRRMIAPALALALFLGASGFAAERTHSGLSFPPTFASTTVTGQVPAIPTTLIAPMQDPATSSPSDYPVSAPAVASCDGNCGGVCGTGCGIGSCQPCLGNSCGLLSCCRNSGKPKSLFKNCWMTEKLGIKVGGWIQQGYTYNAGIPSDDFNGPVALNDRHDAYQMNQAWLFFDKQAQNDGCGLALGGHLDLVYGSDWRFGVNTGLEDRINPIGNEYGLVIPQAYVDVAYNDLTIRMGHYAGLLSYEQVPSVLNFFYSHSYTMGYGEPLLVTGVNANYKLGDKLAIDAGFHRGWMRWEDNNNDLDFMGGLTWTTCDKATKLRFMVNAGPQDDLGLQDQYACSFMWEQTFTKRLRYALQHVYGVTNNGDLFNQGEDAQYYSLVNYVYYQLNPCWSAGMRLEWFKDEDGSRVAGLGSLGRYGWNSTPGFEGDFGALSLGLNWRPRANIVVRPEARWDWYDGSNNAVSGLRPFDGGTQDEQLTLAADVIITF